MTHPTPLIDELRALIEYANRRHWHATADYLTEVVERAEGRMQGSGR